MSTLSTFNSEILKTAFNTAVRSAIQGLSEIVGEPLEFTLQDVCVLESNEVSALFRTAKKFGVVKDECSGLLNAEMLLMFDVDGVFCILKKMLGAEANDEMIRECENEAMCELGNIMIIRCLSAVADFLHVPLESTLPSYDIKSNDELVTYIKNAKYSDFVLTSCFDLLIEERLTKGKLFFLMNKTEMDRFTASEM